MCSCEIDGAFKTSTDTLSGPFIFKELLDTTVMTPRSELIN